MNAGRAVIAGVGLMLGSATAVAQEKQLPRVTVTCIDVDGEPVAGAEVYMFQGKGITGRAGYEPSGPHRTGAGGVAATAIAIDYRGGCFDRWFYARVPGKLVGGLRWLRFDANGPAWPEKPVIRLQPSREIHGFVRAPEGVDVRTARVRTLSLSALDDSRPSGSQLPRYFEFQGLRDTLRERFDATVGEDGTFVLKDVPTRALVYLAAEGPGLAQSQWFNALLPERRIPDVVEMKMQREAALVATVTGPALQPLANVEVKVRLESHDPHTGVRCTFEGRSDAAGHVRIGGLPAGEYAVDVAHGEYVLRPQSLTLAASETTKDLVYTLEQAVEVRGIVRGLPGNVPLERVGMSAITDDDRHRSLGFAQTDPQGRFVLRLPAGPAMLHVAGVPAGYQPPPATYDKLLRLDVQPGDKALTELVFELQTAK